ncbi:MAG TPA: lysylphosphatidylglycerol synthase domain-containing protein, partial [Solirubrobacterales bacterium]|nr:lysylphosphatidylglycerol synthase domain-containing protein [Solirubrobacterales bacterium]
TAAGALALAGFVWVQQRELFGGGSRVLAWLGLGGRLARHAADVDRGLVRYYRHRRARCGLSILFHLLGWIAGSLEAWASLQLLGVPASLVTALVVEASVTAVRSATFFIPGSVGAQEGSLVGVVLALGLPPEVGLTLGIVRRLREGVWAALGYLVLVSWRRRSP